MEHLFKLGKDGKTVGYLWIRDGYITYHTHPDAQPEPSIPIWDAAHPFVCQDKNGKRVFEDDNVIYGCQRAIVKQNDGDFGYHLEFMDLPVMEPIKTGKKVTNILYREMCKDIELIKEK